MRLASTRCLLLTALVIAACAEADTETTDSCDSPADGPGNLVGFDVDSGEARWSSAVGDPSGATVIDEMLVVTTEGPVVRGVTAATGRVAWCVEPEPPQGESVAVAVAAGGRVAILTGGDVVALDPATGAERWRRSAGGGNSILLGGEDFVLADAAADRGPVAALDPETGADLPLGDRHASDEPPAGSFSPTERRRGALHLATAWTAEPGGQRISLTVADAEGERWAATVPGFVATLLGDVDDPSVLVLDQTGDTGELSMSGPNTFLTAYDATSGDERWSVPLPGSPSVVAEIGSGLAAVPDGVDLRAVDLASGSTVWVETLPTPGRGGVYTEPGTWWFLADATDDIAVAVGQAQAPYRG